MRNFLEIFSAHIKKNVSLRAENGNSIKIRI